MLYIMFALGLFPASFGFVKAVPMDMTSEARCNLCDTSAETFERRESRDAGTGRVWIVADI